MLDGKRRCAVGEYQFLIQKELESSLDFGQESSSDMSSSRNNLLINMNIKPGELVIVRQKLNAINIKGRW